MEKRDLIYLVLATLVLISLFLAFSVFNKSINEQHIKKSPKIEQEILEKQTIEGTLEVIIADDFENKKAYYYYYLRTDDGKRYSLEEFSETDIKSGSRIKLTGIISLDEKTIENPENIQFIEPPEHQQDLVGEQRVAVILINDRPGYEPLTPQNITTYVFEGNRSINQYFREVSFGQSSFNGDSSDIYGWYTLDNLCSGVSINTILALSDPDIYFPDYDFLIILRALTQCYQQNRGGPRGWFETLDGRVFLGIVYLSPGLFRGGYLWVGVHEIGHTFGLSHANGLLCRELIPPDANQACGWREYGNPYDTQGGYVPRQYPRRDYTFHWGAEHKLMLGWLTDRNNYFINQSGTYIIEPIELSAEGNQMLSIARDTIPTSPNPLRPEMYLVEYRKLIGFDSEMALFGIDINNSILINYRSINPLQALHTYLIDTHPQTYRDFIDSPLHIGEIYLDMLTGLTITPVSRTSSGMRVMASYSILKNPFYELDLGIDYYPDWDGDDSIANNFLPDGFRTTPNGVLSNIKYQGNKSIKIITWNDRGYSYQDIPVEYNKRYRVTGYVKTDCNDSNCYGTILSECEKQDHTPIWDYSNCKLNINPINIRRLYGDNNWTYIEFDVENNRQDARFLRVLCYNTPGPLPVGSGTVWCDSFNVIEVPRGPVGSPLFLKAIPREG